VETNAVIAPQYYPGAPGAARVATKPYLARTYPAISITAPDIADWRLTWVTATIGVGGDSLTSYDGNTAMTIPAGSFTDTVILAHTPATGMSPGDPLAGIGHVFDLSAVYSATSQPASLTGGATYTLTVHYDEGDLGFMHEESLALYTWGGGQWVAEPSSVVNPAGDTVMATSDHLSLWAVFGEEHNVLLPIIFR
jgi:hypothetical protein